MFVKKEPRIPPSSFSSAVFMLEDAFSVKTDDASYSRFYTMDGLGTLRSNDVDGNENVKKNNRVLLAKQQLCTCTMLFCTFLCPFLHDYDVNMPNFAFYGGRKQATRKCYFSFWTCIWSLGIQLQEGSPTFDKIKWVGRNNCDKDWKSANSPFKRRSHCRRVVGS